MTDEEYPCDPGYCQILELHEHIKALTAENKRLGQQCEGLMQAGMNNGQALIIAEAKLAKAVEALREIAGECGCSTARAIIAEIEGGKL
jgi:hypothetical protein